MSVGSGRGKYYQPEYMKCDPRPDSELACYLHRSKVCISCAECLKIIKDLQHGVSQEQ